MRTVFHLALPAVLIARYVVFIAFGRRGLVDLVRASITALPAALAALVCYGLGTLGGTLLAGAALAGLILR